MQPVELPVLSLGGLGEQALGKVSRDPARDRHPLVLPLHAQNLPVAPQDCLESRAPWPGADLANAGLSSLVARPRPNGIQIQVFANLGQHSFPSGHVTHVVTFYGFLLYLTFRFERDHPRWTPLLWGVRVICLYFLIFIGPSRVLEGAHWPSDVLGSYLLASLMLVIAIALYHLLLLGFARLHDWLAMRKAQVA